MSEKNQPEDPIKTERVGKKLPQYIAALSVCLGALAAGGVLGWTSNIATELQDGSFNEISMDDEEFGWVGSFATLGSLVACIFIGKMCDWFGRKIAMLLLILPFSLGWLLIIFAQNLAMLYVGRFITGFAGGAFCVSAPLYTSEISENEIRGALGSYYQLFITIGILFAYVLGYFLTPIPYTIVLAVIPLVFGVVFVIQPESPIYRLKQQREEDARKALRRFRGPNYDVDGEIKEIKTFLEAEQRKKVPFVQSFRKRETKVATAISFGLMFFQQASGVNAIIFYTSTIFTAAGIGLDSEIATIIVGVVQVVATFVSSLVVDRLGRRILLIISDCFMAISMILLAVYFTLSYYEAVSEDTLTTLGFLPVLALCVFIVAFSLGFGPIPWMISAEIYPEEVKSILSSAAGVFNWFIAFLITRFYPSLVNAIGNYATFYIFAGVSVVGTVFCLTFVPETKGKSLEVIQSELRGEKRTNDRSGIDNPGFSH